MSTPTPFTSENAPADSLAVGEEIIYRGMRVTVVGEQEPSPNVWGLPWFMYRVRSEGGREGYAKFGPTGHALRVSGECQHSESERLWQEPSGGITYECTTCRERWTEEQTTW